MDTCRLFACITDGKTQEIEVARLWKFAPGTVVVMDRAYVDYKWWERMTQQGVYFVTRCRRDLHYEVIEKRSLPKNRNIRADEIIHFTNYRKGQHYQTRYRRIVLWDDDKQQEVVFLTNHLTWGPTTVAAVYRDRWQIECFFKALKQLLRIRTFVGTSPNAVKTQIWTALIAILLLKYLQLRSTFPWSLSNLCALLRQQLFVYRDLFTWLDQPFHPPPALAAALAQQLELPINWDSR
jgi:IS4 transposase